MKTRMGVLAVFTAVALAGCTSDNAGPHALTPPGVFTLASMGHDNQTLTPGEGPIASATTTYSLPEGARQGKPLWYRLRLHYGAKLSEQSRPGTVTIWASANDEAVAAIDLKVRRHGQRLEVVSSSVGLVEGGRRGASSRLDVEGTFFNFLVYGGVKPGLNELRFDVHQLGTARVESVTIYKDTALLVDSRSPANVTLVPSLVDKKIRAGEPFAVRYALRNTGGLSLPAGGEITIAVTGAKVLGSVRHRIGGIGAGKTVTRAFRLVARRPGIYPLTLSVSTWGGSPQATLAARVSP